MYLKFWQIKTQNSHFLVVLLATLLVQLTWYLNIICALQSCIEYKKLHYNWLNSFRDINRSKKKKVCVGNTDSWKYLKLWNSNKVKIVWKIKIKYFDKLKLKSSPKWY